MRSTNFEIKECTLFYKGKELLEGSEKITELWADVQIDTPDICSSMSEDVLDELADFLDKVIVEGICKPRRLN